MAEFWFDRAIRERREREDCAHCLDRFQGAHPHHDDDEERP